MGVPSNVVERIEKLERIRKHIDRRKLCDGAEQARRKEVAETRAARRQDLLEFAGEIFAWRDTVVKSRDGQRLWSLIGSGTRVTLYAGWFWDGLPIKPRNQVRAHTRVALDGQHHHFLFEEWRNDDAGAPYPYREACRARSPLELVDAVHPALIEELLTYLTGPEAWQPIVDELDRQLARYVTAP